MMKNFVASLFLLLLTIAGFSQAVGYEILSTQNNPKIAWFPVVTLDTLKEAKTLSDINHRFKTIWVASYNSVEISSHCDGVVQSAAGTDDTLTPEQLAILWSADSHCTIEMKVDYLPDNKLAYNPVRTINNTLHILPIYEAKYPGGDLALKAYLRENILDQLEKEEATQITLVKVRFFINEQGEAADVQIFTSSQDAEIDQFIQKALCNMPLWQSAEDAAGNKIRQEFEFSMGTDMMRCDYYQY